MSLEKKIILKDLKIIPTDGGNVLHALKNSESIINNFGEVYFSSIKYNFIRAWKLHTKMTLNLIVPVGMVKFVFYFENTKKFLEYEIGEDNYCRLTVPPKIWFGFQGLNKKQNLIMNISDIEHNQKEMKKKNTQDIQYNWEKK